MTASADQIVPTVKNPWAIFAVAATSVFMMSLDGMVVPVALPAIGDAHPDVSNASMTWVIGASTITVAALVVAVGRIGDRIGRRRLFLAGICFLVVGSALAGLAPHFGILIGARALSGVGAGLLGGSAIGLTLAVFPAAIHTRVITLWTAIGAVGGALGPTIGGLLVEGPGWRWVFLCNVFLGVPAFVAGRSILVDTEHNEDTLLPDMVGAVISAAVLGSLVFALLQGRTSGWTSARVLMAFALAACLVPVLARRSFTHPSPIIQPEVARLKLYRRAVFVAMLIPMAMFSNFVLIVQYLDEVWGYSGVRSGLAILPFSISASLTATFSSRLAQRIGERRLLTMGLTVQTCVLAALGLAAPAEPAWLISVGPALLLLGVAGWGVAFPMANAISARQLDETNYGVGMGIQSMARQVGALTGVALVLGQLGDAPDIDRFRSIWIVLASVTMIAVLASLRLFSAGSATDHEENAVQPS